MNKLLRQFIRLATATCSQCGDINPYLDSDDPKFLCRQCRTRAQAWGGSEKKEQEVPKENHGIKFDLARAHSLNRLILDVLMQMGWVQEASPFEEHTQSKLPFYQYRFADFLLAGGNIPSDDVIQQRLAKILTTRFGTKPHEDIDDNDKNTFVWDFNGDVNFDNDASRVRLSRPLIGTIRLSVIFPK